MPANNQDLWLKYKSEILSAIALSSAGFAAVYGDLLQEKHQLNGWTAGLCPLHQDKKPSFGYNRETGKYKCFSCGSGSVFDFHAITNNVPFNQARDDLAQEFGVDRPAGLKSKKGGKGGKGGSGKDGSGEKKLEGPTLEEYSKMKKLPVKALEEFGLATIERYGRQAIAFPYLDKKGEKIQTRYRTALKGSDKFRWSTGADPKNFYGAHLLKKYKKGKGSYIIICEGESDFQTLRIAGGFQAQALPGSNCWPANWPELLEDFEHVLVCLEPDEGGNAVRRSIDQAPEKIRQSIYYMPFSKEAKDPSSLYLSFKKKDTRVKEFAKAMRRLMQEATPRATYERKHGGVKPEVFLPGEHGPTRARIGSAAFNKAVIPHLPLGEDLYLHGPESVEIAGRPGERNMDPVRINRLRAIIDDNVELIEENIAGKRKFKPCPRDLASELLDNLSHHDIARIRTFARFPVWTINQETEKWILPEPGYTKTVEHYFDTAPNLIKFSPAILDPKNLGDVQQVHDLINPDVPGPLADFPWKCLAGPVNTLAALLTLLVRPAINGTIPLMTVTARRRRTGKTNLVQTIITLAVGSPAVVASLPQNDDEFNKTIIAELREETSAIFFDNVSARTLVDSSPLAALITARSYGGRLLGQSKKVKYDNNAVVFLTGNNLTLSDELIQRTLPIELQPLDDAPEERDLPALAPLVLRYRLHFLQTIHGMVNAWIAAGKPTRRLKTFGGFDTWAETIAGILDLWDLGRDFATNLNDWRADANIEDDESVQFLWAWYKHTLENMRFQSGDSDDSGGYASKELLDIASDADLFSDTVFMRPISGQTRALSKAVIAPLIGIRKRVKDEDDSHMSFIVRKTGSPKRGYLYNINRE